MYKIKNKSTVDSKSKDFYNKSFSYSNMKFEQNILSTIYFKFYLLLSHTDYQFYSLHLILIFDRFINDKIIINKYRVTDDIIDEFITILSDIKTNDIIMECKNDICLIEYERDDLSDWKNSTNSISISNAIISNTILNLNSFIKDQVVPKSFYIKDSNFNTNQNYHKKLLENSFKETKNYIENFQLNSYVSNIYNNKDHFKLAKEKINTQIDTFKTSINYTLFESSKGSPLTKEHYMSFLLDDITKNGIYEKFTNAMKVAFQNHLLFIYYTDDDLEERKYKPVETQREKSLNNLLRLTHYIQGDEKKYYQLWEIILKNNKKSFSLFPALIITFELNLSKSNGIKLAESIHNNSINKKTFKNKYDLIGNLIYSIDIQDQYIYNQSDELLKDNFLTRVSDNIKDNYKKTQTLRMIFSNLTKKQSIQYSINDEDIEIFFDCILMYLSDNKYKIDDIIYFTTK